MIKIKTNPSNFAGDFENCLKEKRSFLSVATNHSSA